MSDRSEARDRGAGCLHCAHAAVQATAKASRTAFGCQDVFSVVSVNALRNCCCFVVALVLPQPVQPFILLINKALGICIRPALVPWRASGLIYKQSRQLESQNARTCVLSEETRCTANDRHTSFSRGCERLGNVDSVPPPAYAAHQPLDTTPVT